MYPNREGNRQKDKIISYNAGDNRDGLPSVLAVMAKSAFEVRVEEKSSKQKCCWAYG